MSHTSEDMAIVPGDLASQSRAPTSILSAWRQAIPVRLSFGLVSLAIGLGIVLGLQHGVRLGTADIAIVSKDDGLDNFRKTALAAAIAQGFTPADPPHVWLLPMDAETSSDATVLTALLEARTTDSGQAHDLLRMTLSRPPGGQPTRIGPVFNLTHTRDADERIEAVSGRVVLSSTWLDKRCLGLIGIDFAGEPDELTADWPDLDKYKIKISNWQETGQISGLGRHTVLFRRPLSTLAAEADPASPRSFNVGQTKEQMRWHLTFAIPALATGPEVKLLIDEAALPVVHRQNKGRPGHLGWTVDTVRDISWIGPNKIQELEHFVFEALDTLKLGREAMLGPVEAEAPELAAGDHKAPVEVDPAQAWLLPGERQSERIWPPKPGKTVLEPPGPGEGQWVPMTQLVKEAPDNVPYFYQSWIRPDPKRSFAQVSVTAWDSARIGMGFVAGTREPDGTTGLKGTGLIPRRPGLLPSVVAAFNGGFQTKHGHWGMVVERQVLLPPLGGGATVATTDDNTIVMGTWPAAGPPERGHRVPPGKPLPKSIVSMRQNLQPLVDSGKLNPTGRIKWGGAAGVGTDGTHTTRTGICLLEGGGLAYFFGHSLSANTIGMAMLQFNCQYGLHLDMNSGHSGFEFYNIKDDEAKDFEARRMVKHMGHMKFPRYVQRDVRDFFYLSLRPQLAEQLATQTRLDWRRPFPGDAKAPAIAAAAPARVVEANMENKTRLLRLPRGDIQGQVERLLTDITEETIAANDTAVLASVTIPAEANAHLRLSPWDRFGTLEEDAGEPGTTTPVVVFAHQGKKAALEITWASAPILLLALSETHTIFAEVPANALDTTLSHLMETGFAEVIGWPLAEKAHLGLVYSNASGERHIERGERIIGADLMTFQLRATGLLTARAETLFESESP